MSGIFIIKENLPFGEDYLIHTSSDNAAVCYRLFTGTETEGRTDKLNVLLENRYGIVKSFDGTKPAYEIVNIKAGRLHCEKCGIDINQNQSDFSRFSIINSDGDIMGELFRQDFSNIVQIMKMLDSYGCPVCGGWDDGNGNICSPNGWGRTEFFFKNSKLITKLG